MVLIADEDTTATKDENGLYTTRISGNCKECGTRVKVIKKSKVVKHGGHYIICKECKAVQDGAEGTSYV